MFKWSMRSLLLVFVLLFVSACQNTGDTGNEEGMKDGNSGAEQTRYEDGRNDVGDTDTPLVDRNHKRGDRDLDNNRRDGRNDVNRNDDNNRNNMNENRNNRNNMNNTRNDNRYDIADEAADKITDKVDDIDSATVLTTQNNAYVAAKLNNKNRDNNDKVSDDVKKQVSKAVKETDNNIDNVYVSTNPDFIDLTNNYADDIDQGKPVKGFFDQMGDMINRLFPNNK